MTVIETHGERAVRPRFAADQATVPVGRRVTDFLAMAGEIAAMNEYCYPIRLSGADRLRAAMLLPNTTDSSEVLLRVIGELVEAEQADRVFDHNDSETEPGEKYRQSAADITRDALLADDAGGSSWRCGKCDGADLPLHSPRCPLRTEPSR